MSSKYYQLVEDSERDEADLYIFGDISSWGQWGAGDANRSAYNIVNELQEVKAKSITVHINSYGGEVSEGLAIYNTLKTSGKNVTTVCDGFACSAASVVFMAGKKRVMNKASLLMVHNAWTMAEGNAEELRKAAEDIEKITKASIEAYKENVKISEEKIKELMDEEAWITPNEAVEYGFATEVKKTDPEEGAQQSARDIVFRKLTEPWITLQSALDDEMVDKLADMVSDRIDAKQKKRTPIDESGWNEFFKKGE